MAIITKKLSEIPKASKGELERFDAIDEDEIDLTEIPELDKEWFNTAEAILPGKKKNISLRIDEDVLKWFKSNAKSIDYQTFMSAVLISYVKAQKEKLKKA